MERQTLVGVLAAIGGVMLVSGSAAGSTTSRIDSGVKFTVGVVAGEATLRAEGKGVTLSKRLTADRVHVRIDVPGDVFEVDAQANGTARLTRNGKRLDLQMSAPDAGAKAQRFAAGSRALAGFEALAASLEASTAPEAQSVLTSFALIHAVRGSVAPVRSLAQTVKQTHAVNARWAAWGGEQRPQVCWVEYGISMNQALNDLNSCYLNYGWIPGMAGVCAFEWSVRAELSWFWLLSCSGGIPLI